VIKSKILTAICCGVSLFAFLGAAPQDPLAQSGALPGGGTYVVRPDGGAATTAIELWFRAPGAGYDSKYPGISRLALTTLAASRPPHGTSLAELVKGLGGTLTLNVYPDIAMVGVSVPSWNATNVAKALTAAYFTPSVTDDGLKAALRDCAIAGTEARFDADRLLQDALFAHLFVSGPAHYSPTPTAAAHFSKIPVDQVKAFATRAFSSPNAVMSIAGNVDSKVLSEVVNAPALHQARANGRGDAPLDSTVSNRPADVTQDASVSGLGFAWTGPPITDERSATAMDFIADYLFDPDHGTLSLAARKNKSTLVNGQFITLHNPGVLLLTISGTGASNFRQQVLDTVNAMRQPLDRNTFDAARAAFEYHIFSQIQTPLSRADNFGWYAAEGNLGYAPGNDTGTYLKAARSLTADFVAQTVRTYLQQPSIVQLTGGKQLQGTPT
jgi:predicted Zn-dependent peptidase